MKKVKLFSMGFMAFMMVAWSVSVHAGFVNNGNGTVTDTSTGLIWQQDTARDGSGNHDNMNWKEALAYCEALELGGQTDWRLPTVKELGSLVDLSRTNPAINTTYFPNTVSSHYWSSTTNAGSTRTPGSSISTMATAAGAVRTTTLTFGPFAADSLGHWVIWIILSFRPFLYPRQ